MNIWQLVRYGISGVVGIGVNVSVLYMATELLSVWYLLSAVVAFCVSYAVTFSLQKYWTFKDYSGALVTQGIAYLVIALISLSLDALMLYVAVDVYGFWYLGSQIVIMSMLALFSFLANRSITFTGTYHV